MTYENEYELMKYLESDLRTKQGWPNGMKEFLDEIKRNFPDKYEYATDLAKKIEDEYYKKKVAHIRISARELIKISAREI